MSSVVHKGAFEVWQLNVGDLCMFVGKTDIHKSMRYRIIYQVIDKEDAPHSSFSHNRYTLRVAFDFENPSGTSTETVTHLGTTGMRKLSLLDLGTLRMHFDEFIKWWARGQGMEDGAPAPEPVEDRDAGGAPAEARRDPDPGKAQA